jgi:hypothetical protein
MGPKIIRMVPPMIIPARINFVISVKNHGGIYEIWN